MKFLAPVWLLTALPLWLSLHLWRLPTKVMRITRMLIYLLIILAMADPILELKGREGTVVMVVDKSLSMPADSETSIMEAVNIVCAARPSHGQTAVISFGESAVIESAPGKAPFTGFMAAPGVQASDLSTALEKALSLLPRESSARILVFSDGLWTGANPMPVMTRAAARNIPIDFRHSTRTLAGDLAIYSVEAPHSLEPDESFMMTLWIQSPEKQSILFTILRDGSTLLNETRTIPAGLSPIVIHDKIGNSGTAQYSFHITGNGKDPIPENNSARVLISINGAKPLLLVTANPDSSLDKFLMKSGIKVRSSLPEYNLWTLEELSRYSGIILENVPANDIGLHGMKILSGWVSEMGDGLMLTGGKNSFGPGGYFKSPLEEILPVSLELRSEHRKLSLALVIVLDRSGSMSMTASFGRTKMDLANTASAEVVKMLTHMDELGVLAVDTQPHVIAPLQTIKNKDALIDSIMSIQSMGGGIYVYDGLNAAAEMLSKSEAKTRHIILFSDASDSEKPGQLWELLPKCRKANITVSVIGLGHETDQDAEILKDIARMGEGRIFFTQNAEDLPRLFAQDTFAVTRSAFVDEPVMIKAQPGLHAITGLAFDFPAPIGGYNLCYARPNIELAATTQDEYSAPYIAAWNAGIGRVLCFTGEIDGEYTGEIGKWKDYGSLITSMVRWISEKSSLDFDRNAFVQSLSNGVYRLSLYLDTSPEENTSIQAPTITVMRASKNGEPLVSSFTMEWKSADLLELEYPLTGDDTIVSIAHLDKRRSIRLPPVCLPYSAEFTPQGEENGMATLEMIAKGTGGTERIDPAGIWKDLPLVSRHLYLQPFLLLSAILLFLSEILERRTGLVSGFLNSPRSFFKIPEFVYQPKTVDARKKVAESPANQTFHPADNLSDQQQNETQVETAKQEEISDSLSQAMKEAKRRFKNK